jgi:hypothetical protein
LAVWRVSLPLLKRVLKVSTLARFMWSPPAVPLDERGRRQRVELVRGVVTSAGRLLVSTNCLERSLVLYRLLSQADAQPALVLGARRGSPSVAGHAWVELGGEPVFEPDRDAYTAIVAFGPDGFACPVSELHALA